MNKSTASFAAWLLARQKRAHVAGYAGHPEQTRLGVDELFNRAGVHPPLVHEVKNHTGVKRAAAVPIIKSLRLP